LNRTITIAPVRKSIVVQATPQRAFEVFTAGIDRLSDAPFFVGDSITLADILLAPQLDFFRATPEWEPLSTEHENVRTWLDRMNARPSMVATTWERVAAMANAA
jgi:glutathione S-transferase